MKNLFALFPLLSIYFLFHSSRTKFKVNAPLILTFTLLCLILGHFFHLIIPGTLYASLFVLTGIFPVFLRREVKQATERYRAREKTLREQVDSDKFGREKWIRIRQRAIEEMDRISKRYSFAKTLVARTDEKLILTDLSTIFGTTRMVLGLAFSSNLEKETKEKGHWVPSFSSGWVAEEDWSRLLKRVPAAAEKSGAYNLPKETDLAEQMKSETLHMVYSPVKWGGEVQGLLTLLMAGPVSHEFLDEISVYAQLLGLGLHKAYLYHMVIEHSRRDGLTNLYLRSIFLERLSEEINFSKRYGTSFSVLILDLDHFKAINDTYGHVIGDKVLRSVAECLKSVLHPGVTIARYGGEEFAILIGLAPADEIVETAEMIRHSIEHLVFTLSDDASSSTIKIGRRKGEIRITISIGIAHYLPDAVSPDELIRRADAALYWAKEAGRNCAREWNGLK